ncbi:Mut7-C RNAse domain-containing protein [Massilia sp. GCM10023247]|uniref:Mut7-C RNAse domain-containing protein n=1 Tax=Massilia sp. GCM10023247 TaxID=3252643 RepID=UPI00361BDC63
MVTATFRFHGELNAFLPRARRAGEFALPCARAATTKHMIEALGVPHTEVARVLVNGEPAGLDRMLADGDRVAVYPTCDPFEPSPSAQAPQAPRFVADAHLGGLARLLRMAGFDTLYDNAYADEAIAAIAAADARVLLTRDRELLKRRTVEHGCYLHAIRPEAQLRELYRRLGLAPLARPFSLCLHCNLPLRPSPKSEVLARLPESVRLQHDEFTTCDRCGRVYWKGTHHRRMAAMLEGVAPAGAPAAVESTAPPQPDGC